MPSQEPQLDDKNDEVDLPSEETDGSEYFLILNSCLSPFGGSVSALPVWFLSSLLSMSFSPVG